jgi:hypothetical protein
MADLRGRNYEIMDKKATFFGTVAEHRDEFWKVTYSHHKGANICKPFDTDRIVWQCLRENRSAFLAGQVGHLMATAETAAFLFLGKTLDSQLDCITETTGSIALPCFRFGVDRIPLWIVQRGHFAFNEVSVIAVDRKGEELKSYKYIIRN